MKATLIVPVNLPDDITDDQLAEIETSGMDAVAKTIVDRDDLMETGDPIDESRQYGLFAANKQAVVVTVFPLPDLSKEVGDPEYQ